MVTARVIGNMQRDGDQLKPVVVQLASGNIVVPRWQYFNKIQPSAFAREGKRLQKAAIPPISRAFLGVLIVMSRGREKSDSVQCALR